MAQPQIPQLFGIIPTSHPCITFPTSAPTPTSYIYVLPVSPSQRPFSHITVFLLPGITLPPNTAAAVYISLPPAQNEASSQPQFKFLGGIGPGKESAVFKISGLAGGGVQNGIGSGEGGEVDMDSDVPSSSPLPSGGEITLGISLESAESISSQMASLHSSSSTTTTTTTHNPENSQALVLARSQGAASKPETLILAQRIIKNAFNFLASFSGNVNGAAGGVEVVPLKAFEEWWRKFEGRVRSDPGFLEREGD